MTCWTLNSSLRATCMNGGASTVQVGVRRQRPWSRTTTDWCLPTKESPAYTSTWGSDDQPDALWVDEVARSHPVFPISWPEDSPMRLSRHFRANSECRRLFRSVCPEASVGESHFRRLHHRYLQDRYRQYRSRPSADHRRVARCRNNELRDTLGSARLWTACVSRFDFEHVVQTLLDIELYASHLSLYMHYRCRRNGQPHPRKTLAGWAPRPLRRSPAFSP